MIDSMLVGLKNSLLYRDMHSGLASHSQMEQTELPVYSYDKTVTLPLTPELLASTLKQLIQLHVQPLLGHSCRVHLYQQPLCPFTRLQFLPASAPLSAVIRAYGPLCLTYQNTQYHQQPEYQHAPVYSQPQRTHSLQLVVQICQNNLFFHENYRLPYDTKLSFLRMCSRYGTQVHLSYYDMRVRLDEFSGESLIEGTLLRVADHMGRVTVTVDSHEQVWGCLREARQGLVDTRGHFVMRVSGETGAVDYVIDRRAKIDGLKYMLAVQYGQEVSVTDVVGNEIDHYPPDFDTIIVNVKKGQQRAIALPLSLDNCEYIGSMGSPDCNNLQLLLIRRSRILYRIRLDLNLMQSQLLCVASLPCTETTHLDQDLFMVRDEKLISFAITINMVKVKTYTLQGELLQVRIHPWYHQLYEIQFQCVDLFCVRLTNDRLRVRVFYIYQPQHYIEVPACQAFFPARLGNSKVTDSSGVFAITDPTLQQVHVYNIHEGRLPQLALRPESYSHITDVVFSQHNGGTATDKTRKIYLNYNNKSVGVYGWSGELISSILCEKGMGNLFCVGQRLVSSTGGEVRHFQEGGGWGAPVCVRENALVVVPGGVLVREKLLQYSKLKECWYLDQ